MTTERAAALVAALVLLSVVLPAGALAATGNLSGASGPADTDVPEEQLALSELQNGGTVVDEDVPSLRVQSETSAMWLKNYPPGLMSNYGNPNKGSFVTPSTTVQRDRVRLIGTHAFDGEQHEYELVKVYWTEETREVQEGNVSREQDVAKIHAVDDQQVSFGAGFQETADVTLRSHHDETVHVTTWVRGHDDVRWTFQHKSIPVSQQVNIETQAGLLEWVLKNIVAFAIPTMLGLAFVTKKAVDRAGAGPLKGASWWVKRILAVGAIAMLVAYTSTTTAFVRLPQLLGVMLGALGALAVLVSHNDAMRVLFEKPELQDVVSPNSLEPGDLEDADVATDGGDHAIRKDSLAEEMTEHYMVRISDGPHEGDLAIVKPGLRNFLARIWADPAIVDDRGLKTNVKVRGKWDWKYYVDPESDEIVEVEPPGWSLNLNLVEESDEDGDSGILERLNWTLLLGAPLSLGIGWSIGQWLFGQPVAGVAIGALPIIAAAAHAQSGWAHVEAAPLHQRSAKQSVVAMERDIQDARTFEEQEEQLTKSRMRPIKQAYALLRQRGEARSDELMDIFDPFEGDDAEALENVDDVDLDLDAGDKRRGEADD